MNRTADLKDRLTKLDNELKEKEAQNETSRKKLNEMQGSFNAVKQSKIWRLMGLPKKFKSSIRATVAYMLGRRNIKQVYSKSYKRKKAANQLKKYKYQLYDLGFTEKVLTDLESLYKETESRYVKQAIAWELTLWHANKYTKDGARQALEYIPAAISGGKDQDYLRKAAIIKAECLDRLHEIEAGKRVIKAALALQKHPDLYLAAANLEETLKERVKWMNKSLDVYGIQPVFFASSEEETATYEDLTTKSIGKTLEEGPKVSVIIPAYNAEKGIGTAIESMLSQTWQNLELLVVDDCSLDNTVDVIKAYMKKDSRVKLLTTPVNSGPYVARNIALKAATGEFVTINDADDWSHAEKIETQVKHLIKNKQIIANTSEQTRLTEELKVYRRGTPGNYIFSNMSSLMFRRVPVTEEIGYWDSVRFAADSEFKRRIIAVFGEKSMIDLKTGPLSFPRQSMGSLTGSSAFGYNGFLKGVRKEYAEVHRQYHQKADTLHYSYPQGRRPFPVPEPMWTNREIKPSGSRHFDVVIVSDFRLADETHLSTIEEMKTQTKMGLRTGLIQMARYDFSMQEELNPQLREAMDANNVPLLVYGEHITCDILIVKHPQILQEQQTYIPNVAPRMVRVVVDQPPNGYNLRRCARHLVAYFGKRGKWYPLNLQIRETLKKYHTRELKSIKLASDNWADAVTDREAYASQLENWFVDDNPYVQSDAKGGG
ncbi:glycosyltransferase involved in cell wall biosynthesis [Virgibacillus natechei]|uniref:Glycosyltransferase involved in cell wall biosynthesis n=1 Tax=Virgibacillus natechei TaxID=1216297 RepID=A0ABS4IKI2_9BACI|nr:glycosyltransferase family 2 protein [Virgibacillus natechei]MBP1971482.1 glycosyltransferase involved in cell wall biosynthesis [Virgibacillus natechei]UZD12536.1 glycosyltransferase [Virgibacillus natechei]